MPGHDVVVVGASTGGVEALIMLVGGLPPDLPASVFIVLHLPPDGRSHLPEILARATRMPVVSARDGQPIQRQHIYVAPPDYHLLVGTGAIQLGTGPHENRVRPAVDPLFRSAARSYGPRVVGVVLTGALNDGTAGMIAIKRRGGIAVVQDPRDAYFPSMPASVLRYVHVDYHAPLRSIPEILTQVVHEPARDTGVQPVEDDIELESRIAQGDPGAVARESSLGELSSMTCPECHGPLWERHDGTLLRFRCRVGHAYTAESLSAASGEAVENALAAAFNALFEQAQTTERLASEARLRDRPHLADHYETRAVSAQRHAEVIRQMLVRKDEDIHDLEAIQDDGDEVENQEAGASS